MCGRQSNLLNVKSVKGVDTNRRVCTRAVVVVVVSGRQGSLDTQLSGGGGAGGGHDAW